jgi:transglutaminase-like putative cysteine protease
MEMEVYRTSKADALEKVDAVGPDLFSSMMIKVDRPVPHPHQTQQARYRVHLEGGDPAGVFVTGPTQAVKSLDAHTAEITVYAVRPGRSDGNPNAPADPPTDDDLRPNTFIQSDDPTIVADAEKAAGGRRDPWQVATALESYVNREVKNKDYTQAFATAAEVAKSLEGDCTEHAVFLAALMRARGIPARVAVGLVYLESKQAFFYHMWTEVYIDKRWVPVDGTLALGGIGVGHLTIAQSNLKSAFSAFLPVMQVAGRLRIEVMDVK